VNGDFGGEVVGEIVELAAAADGHEDGGGTFFDGDFDDGYWVVDGFDGAAEVETAGHDGAALEAFLEEGGAEGEEDSDADSGATFGTVEGAELDGEFVGARVAVADQFFCPDVEVLFGAADGFFEGRRGRLIEDFHTPAWAFGDVDAEQTGIFSAAAPGQLNSFDNVESTSRSENASTSAIIRERFGAEDPLPNFASKCRDSVTTIFAPYSARFYSRTSRCIRLPTCQSSSVSEASIMRDPHCRADGIWCRRSRSKADAGAWSNSRARADDCEDGVVHGGVEFTEVQDLLAIPVV